MHFTVIPAKAGIQIHRRIDEIASKPLMNARLGGARVGGSVSMDKQPCIYILASRRHGTLYIGVTSNLMGRLHQHREGLIKGFTSRYGVHHLVWFEMAETMDAAITREKQLKKWNRDWKLRLIEESNSDWSDLAIGLGFEPMPSSSFPRRRESIDAEHKDTSAGPAIMDPRLRGDDGVGSG